MQNVCFGAMALSVAFPPVSAVAAGAHRAGAVDVRLPGPPICPCTDQRKLG
jgi:hypothetical protein